MASDSHRAYRKNFASHGLIYLEGEEFKISIKDISLTGVLAHLRRDNTTIDAGDMFNMLSSSTTIDLYLPELRLASEAEIVRVDKFNDNILLALEFKNVTYNVDNQLYKRKAHRKNMTAPGKILLDGKYREFITINVSIDGLMIKLYESVAVEAGDITAFEFEQLELNGEIKVAWVEDTNDGGTLLGLEYLHRRRQETDDGLTVLNHLM